MEVSQSESCQVFVELVFSNARNAEIAYDVIRVDKEPKRSDVKRVVTVSQNKLCVSLTSHQLRKLRVASNSILDQLILVMETMEAFGPPVSDKYSHYNA